MPEFRQIGPDGNANVPPMMQVIERTFQAARTTLRPTEYTTPSTTLGHFKTALSFSNAANITTTPLITLRWTDANSLFVLHKLRWTAAILTTAFTTQQLVDVAATIARGFSAPDTGGASKLPAAANQMARTSMGNSILQQLLVGSSAITAGTRTLDGTPFAYASCDVASNTVATGGTPLITSPKELYQLMPGADHPVVLAANEGIVINCPNSLAVVGVVKWGFVLEWAEVPQY